MQADNKLDLVLIVSLLSKCCDIPGLGDHQSPILADIECHPKNKKQYLEISISGRKLILNYYVKLSNKMWNSLLLPLIQENLSTLSLKS